MSLLTRTTQDLAQRVMEILGLLEAQESVTAEDAALIKRVYEGRHAEWAFRNLAYWQIDEIPVLAFESLAGMMAGEVAPSFSAQQPIVMDENGQQIGVSVKGLRDLRRIVQVEMSGLPTVGVFY